jgi:hypothetical protein
MTRQKPTPAKLSPLFDDVSDASAQTTPLRRSQAGNMAAVRTPFRSPIYTPLRSPATPQTELAKRYKTAKSFLAKFLARKSVIVLAIITFVCSAIGWWKYVGTSIFQPANCGSDDYKFNNRCLKVDSPPGAAYAASGAIRDFIKQESITSINELMDRASEASSQVQPEELAGMIRLSISFMEDLQLQGDKIVAKVTDQTKAIVLTTLLVGSASILVGKLVALLL